MEDDTTLNVSEPAEEEASQLEPTEDATRDEPEVEAHRFC
jgi:hypothetical protein